MYSHTKKVGSAGRYGPRLGRKLRNEITRIEDDGRASGRCPSCGRTRVKRKSAGIWSCRSCKTEFAGAAYRALSSVKKAGEGQEE